MLCSIGKQVQSTSASRNYDVVFIMDSSSEVSPRQYQSQKEYVKQVFSSLAASSDQARAAFIIYSDYGVVKSTFRQYQSLQKFAQDVDSAELLGGKRHIDKALETAAAQFDGDRPSSERLVILLTAGSQDQHGTKSLNDAVRPLRSVGAKTYVVAIGDRVDNDELRPAVERPDDIIKMPSFTVLEKRAEDTVKHVLGIKGLSLNFSTTILIYPMRPVFFMFFLKSCFYPIAVLNFRVSIMRMVKSKKRTKKKTETNSIRNQTTITIMLILLYNNIQLYIKKKIDIYKKRQKDVFRSFITQ